MTTGFIILPIAQLSTLTGYQASVDVVLGLPKCNCASCDYGRRSNCTRVGGCSHCTGGLVGTLCPTYGAPGSDPMHNIAVTDTYFAPITSSDGTQCAYLYDATSGPIIDPGSAMTPTALPDGWYS